MTSLCQGGLGVLPARGVLSRWASIVAASEQRPVSIEGLSAARVPARTVSPHCALHFMVAEGNVNGEVFVDYCQRLLDDNVDRPACLVRDGYSARRAERTTEFVASTSGRLELFFLPGYSPQQDPNEWVWKNVAADRSEKAGVTSKEDLRSKAVNVLERLASMPHILCGVSYGGLDLRNWPSIDLRSAWYFRHCFRNATSNGLLTHLRGDRENITRRTTDQ